MSDDDLRAPAPARPYTPEMLAERWDCSAETVRALVREGRLPAFRVGRMMRIAARIAGNSAAVPSPASPTPAPPNGAASPGNRRPNMGDAMAPQPILPFSEGAWRVPHWCHDMGYMRSSQVLKLIKANADLIARAQMDGIEHVAPILLALRCGPADARKRVGKAVWKQVHHSPLALNVARANIMLRSRIRLHDLVEFPAGALREVMSKARETSEAAVTAAGLIARNRTEFRHAVMLAHDTQRMGGDIDRRWSLRRLREEHDRRAMEWARVKSDPTPWGDPWSCEMGGFTFTLLNSFADFSAEGQTMHHCVASYARDAKAGRYIIMRIDGEERATVRFGGHPVYVQEVKGRFNAAATYACRVACTRVCAEHLTNGERDA